MNDHQSEASQEQRNGIGTLNEFSLHADIINYLAQKGDSLEADLEGYVIDILRGSKILEIQTKNLAKLMPKIKKLQSEYEIQVIHPIQAKKTIVRKNNEGEVVSKRVSPKKGRIEDIFDQLVHAPNIIKHPNVSLDILMIEAEEVWRDDGKGSWRRKYWSISERHLKKIIVEKTFNTNVDFLQLLPKSLPTNFTNKQLAEQLKIRHRLAGKITYTLKKMRLIEMVGKQGNAHIFTVI